MSARLSADGGLAYLWSPGATLHNTGEEPAMVWVLGIEPAAR